MSLETGCNKRARIAYYYVAGMERWRSGRARSASGLAGGCRFQSGRLKLHEYTRKATKMSVGTPHVARVAVQYGYPDNTNVLENVFYLEDTSDAIFADPAGTALAVFDAAVATYVHQMSNNVGILSASFEDVRTVPFGGITVSAPSATFGSSGTAGTLPSSTAVAISKHSSVLGRSGHGRTYFPVFQANMLSAPDTMVSASAVAIANALAAFQTSLETSLSPAELGWVSYRHAGAARAAGLFVHILTWGVSDLAIDTQRRRLLLHNRHR